MATELIFFLLTAVPGPLKYFTVFFLSTLKFIAGPLAGVALGLSMGVTMALTAGGMMASVLVFSFGGRLVYKWYVQRRREKKKSIFNKSSRRIVKIWQKFGVKGIAFFTPIIFTPIIGTLLAVVLGASRPKILIYMLCSAVLWGVLLTFALYTLKDTLGVKISDWW